MSRTRAPRAGRVPSAHPATAPGLGLDGRPHTGQLKRLGQGARRPGPAARRLLATAPVDVRGVAQARVLLSDGSGPLFWRRSPESLRARIREAIEALEPQTPHRTAWAGGRSDADEPL